MHTAKRSQRQPRLPSALTVDCAKGRPHVPQTMRKAEGACLLDRVEHGKFNVETGWDPISVCFKAEFTTRSTRIFYWTMVWFLAGTLSFTSKQTRESIRARPDRALASTDTQYPCMSVAPDYPSGDSGPKFQDKTQ